MSDVRIDPYEAVKLIADMQSRTTKKGSDAWFALNRAQHILWQLSDRAKLAQREHQRDGDQGDDGDDGPRGDVAEREA